MPIGCFMMCFFIIFRCIFRPVFWSVFSKLQKTMSFFQECERRSNPPFASFFTCFSSLFFQSTFLIRYFCDYQMICLDKSPSSLPTAVFLSHRPMSHICLHSDTILWPNTMPARKSKAAKDEEVEDDGAERACEQCVWTENACSFKVKNIFLYSSELLAEEPIVFIRWGACNWFYVCIWCSMSRGWVRSKGWKRADWAERREERCWLLIVIR